MGWLVVGAFVLDMVVIIFGAILLVEYLRKG